MRKRLAMRFRTALLGVAVTLGATMACAALPAEPEPLYFPALWAGLQNDPLQPIPGAPKPDFSAHLAAGRRFPRPLRELAHLQRCSRLPNPPVFASPHLADL